MNSRKPLLRATACALLSILGICNAGGLPGDDDAELQSLRQSYRNKQWKFIGERAGDRHMTGVLTIFENGRAVWAGSSMTESTSFADIWHESIQVFDSEGRLLFGFGVWDSPGMQDDGSHDFWKNYGEFPKGLFDLASKASSLGEC